MSIIFDALNKTQKHRQAENHAKARLKTIRLPTIPWIKIGILMTISMLFLMLWSHYARIWNTPVAAPHKKLLLNGVFISEQNKIAMINHQSFSVGDMVDGHLKFLALIV